jgi:Protein of unknown function (DUF2855)
MTSMQSGAPRGSWELMVSREDLSRTVLTGRSETALDAGQARLAVRRVGLTANNVTYAVLGESFRYWDFFPADPGFGIVPLWGFAEVVESRADGVDIGGRYYGYLPSASHLVVQPGRIDARGFADAAPHRAGLPSPYNAYALTSGDPAYDPAQEDLLVLFRPLFYTSFMLADQLRDNDFFGAEVLAFSSASSKTAYSTAHLLSGAGRKVVGLTSSANVDFTVSLGVYDLVMSYDDVSALDPTVPAAYLDVSGSPRVASAVRARLGANLVREVIIGVTSQQQSGSKGAMLFFAPDQMRKRVEDWGHERLDHAFAEAWHRFVPAAEGWVDVVTAHGAEDLERVWLEVLAGRTAPRTGHIIVL